MRKIFLPIAFFALTPIILILCISELAYVSSLKNDNPLSIFNNSPVNAIGIAYAALPDDTIQVSGNVGETDARIEKLTRFFHKYRSILEKYSQQIIIDSDLYGIDYRILPAIAMQESEGCRKIPTDSYNCWGFNVTKTKTTKFSSYKAAIDIIAKSLGKYYIGKGLITVEQIGQKWNPDNNNDWIGKVNYFKNQI